MPTPEYRSAPLATTTLPPGIAFIIGNEAAERFSYYVCAWISEAQFEANERTRIKPYTSVESVCRNIRH